MSLAREHTEVIRKPLLTEKISAGMQDGVYAFEVSPEANKHQIKAAVEAIWNVKVDRVRTVNRRGRERRNRFGAYTTPRRRKAYVTLKEGFAIEMA